MGKENLLNFAFLELHVLADLGVVLSDRHLVRHRSGVLLRYIEEPGIGLAVQPDLDGGRFGHGGLQASLREGRLTYLAALSCQVVNQARPSRRSGRRRAEEGSARAGAG